MPRSDLGLLLLHALPLDGQMWESHLGILPERTFAPDLYECGNELRLWAEYCLKHVPTDRFVVAGCSVGGSCALEILRLAPERVAATVLIGTKARHDPDPALAAEAIKTVQNRGIEVAWKLFWEPLFALPNHGAAQNRSRAIALDQSPNDLINGLTAFHTRASREDIVKNSTNPIHVVSGELDKFPGVAYSQRLAALNPKASLHVIESCGHYAPIARPDETSALIAGVINQVTAIR